MINKLNLNKEYIYGIILVVFALFCTLKMASFTLSGGILNPDVSLYLINALKYAGMDYYNLAHAEELFYTPIISFLTSLIFRMGLVDKAAIIIVTSILCFLGYIGLYKLLKIRFNSLLSLTGIIIYGSTSVVIFNLSKGLIDIPAISISIWALYFAIVAIDKNPNYFLISFPLLVIGFFTKYIAGFILPLILLYYLMERNLVDNLDNLISDRELLRRKIREYISSREFKCIILSLIISLVLIVIICKCLIIDFGGSLSFIQQSVNTFDVDNQFGALTALNFNKSYYFDMFLNILFEKRDFDIIFLSGLLFMFFGVSIAIHVVNLLNNNLFKFSGEPFKTKYFNKILVLLLILSLIGFVFGFRFLENNMFSNICMLGSMIIIHSILKKYVDGRCLSLTLLFFTYFGLYFVFLSLYPVQLYRYALPLIPPFICIIVWSLDNVLYTLTNGFKHRECKYRENYSKLSNLILIFLIVVFLLSTIAFIAPMEYERSNDVYQEVLYKGYSNDLADACDYILETDPDYHSKTFASFPNSSRTIMWYLKVNATILEEDDLNLEDYDNSTYLILYKDLELNNYHKLHRCGDFNIYYHN